MRASKRPWAQCTAGSDGTLWDCEELYSTEAARCAALRSTRVLVTRVERQEHFTAQSKPGLRWGLPRNPGSKCGHTRTQLSLGLRAEPAGRVKRARAEALVSAGHAEQHSADRPPAPPPGQAPDLSGGGAHLQLPPNSLCRSRHTYHGLWGNRLPQLNVSESQRVTNTSRWKTKAPATRDHHRDEPACGSQGEPGPGRKQPPVRSEPGARGGRPAANTALRSQRCLWPEALAEPVCLPGAGTAPGRTALRRRRGQGGESPSARVGASGPPPPAPPPPYTQ